MDMPAMPKYEALRLQDLNDLAILHPAKWVAPDWGWRFVGNLLRK